MRVIKPSRVREFAEKFPDAAASLMAWLKMTREADWQSLADVRVTFPNADGVTVKSRHVVTVFNVGGNKYRLIVAIKYKWSVVYVLQFLTHAQYNKESWKGQL
jgi:mRNA interferase HigB